MLLLFAGPSIEYSSTYLGLVKGTYVWFRISLIWELGSNKLLWLHGYSGILCISIDISLYGRGVIADAYGMLYYRNKGCVFLSYRYIGRYSIYTCARKQKSNTGPILLKKYKPRGKGVTVCSTLLDCH